MISGYVITILITVAIYAILAHSLNIITGHAGQISHRPCRFLRDRGLHLRPAVYRRGASLLVQRPLAAITAGIIGALLGIPACGCGMIFLAITTMGINFVVEAVLSLHPSSAGPWGSGINLPGWFGREMTKPEYFILILAVFGLLLLLDHRLGRSWIGLAWASIREDEQAAEAMGVDVVRFKVLAFILGSAIAGLAGGFYAHFLTFIMPRTSVFPCPSSSSPWSSSGESGRAGGRWWGGDPGGSSEFSGRSWSTALFSMGSCSWHDAFSARRPSGLRFHRDERIPADGLPFRPSR